ncbi:hypothetical protein B0H10DRAFT_2436265, partial [Mycena sp. CBHHK59/15]
MSPHPSSPLSRPLFAGSPQAVLPVLIASIPRFNRALVFLMLLSPPPRCPPSAYNRLPDPQGSIHILHTLHRWPLDFPFTSQKKGLFHAHANAVASYLRGTHVVLNARHEACHSFYPPNAALTVPYTDYSAHKEQARKFELIAPGPAPATSSAPLLPTAPTRGVTTSLYSHTVDERTALQEAWPEDPPPVAAVAPPPCRIASPGPPHRLLSVVRRGCTAPTRSPVAASVVPTKPADDDRIVPVGTAYTPVAPKKLKNPFAAFEQQAQTALPAPAPSAGKKLTWSAPGAGEEARRAGGRAEPRRGVPGARRACVQEQHPGIWASGCTGTEHATQLWVRGDGCTYAAASPAAAACICPSAPSPEPEPVPPPAPPTPAAAAGGEGLCAVVLYEHDAAEDNEPLWLGRIQSCLYLLLFYMHMLYIPDQYIQFS